METNVSINFFWGIYIFGGEYSPFLNSIIFDIDIMILAGKRIRKKGICECDNSTVFYDCTFVRDESILFM